MQPQVRKLGYELRGHLRAHECLIAAVLDATQVAPARAEVHEALLRVPVEPLHSLGASRTYGGDVVHGRRAWLDGGRHGGGVR